MKDGPSNVKIKDVELFIWWTLVNQSQLLPALLPVVEYCYKRQGKRPFGSVRHMSVL